MGYPKYVFKWKESKLIDSGDLQQALSEGWVESPALTAEPIPEAEIVEPVKVKRVKKDESEQTHPDVV